MYLSSPVEGPVMMVAGLCTLLLSYAGLERLGVPLEWRVAVLALMVVAAVAISAWDTIRPHTRKYPEIAWDTFSARDLLRAERAGSLDTQAAFLALVLRLEKDIRSLEQSTDSGSVRDWCSGLWFLTVPAGDHKSPRLGREPVMGFENAKVVDHSHALHRMDLSFVSSGHTLEIYLDSPGRSLFADEGVLHPVVLKVHDATDHKEEVRRWQRARRWWFQEAPSASNGLATAAR